MVPQLSIGGTRGWEVTDVNLHSIMKQAVCRLSKGKCCDKAMPNGAATPDLTNQGIINYVVIMTNQCRTMCNIVGRVQVLLSILIIEILSTASHNVQRVVTIM